ncbi:MAG: hypothetical protein J0H68_06720 [Sphingobacteriia bacterium]|nr:hypothetical protein [Sphingobacteriia bacterium]
MKREIPKLPQPPELNKNIIKLLSKLCFKNTPILNPQKIDTLFIFGSTRSLDNACDLVIELIEKYKPKKLILTGGMPLYEDSIKIPKPEPEIFYDLIKNQK